MQLSTCSFTSTPFLHGAKTPKQIPKPLARTALPMGTHVSSPMAMLGLIKESETLKSLSLRVSTQRMKTTICSQTRKEDRWLRSTDDDCRFFSLHGLTGMVTAFEQDNGFVPKVSACLHSNIPFLSSVAILSAFHLVLIAFESQMLAGKPSICSQTILSTYTEFARMQ